MSASANETGLDDALEILRRHHPGPAVPLLVEQLVVGRWQTSRAALAALKREGPAGMVAAPAVAGWLVGSVAEADLERHGYALREALQALRAWHGHAEEAAADGPADARGAADALLAHFAEVVEPAVRGLLEGDRGAAHRGAVDYLAAAARDRPAAIGALRRFLSRPAEDDDAYTRAAAITALQGLSAASAEPPPDGPPTPAAPEVSDADPPEAPLDALTAAHPETDAPFDPLADDVEGFVERSLVPLLLREFESGPPATRMAALSALQRLGTRAEAASAAMWRLIRQGPFEDAEVERLRQRALSAFVPLVVRKLPPDRAPGDAEDAGRAETARTLLIEMAMGDRDPRVRAQALEALSRLADDDQAVWAAAVESANNPQPLVRGTSTRLIALLGLMARRGRLARPPE